MKICSFAYLTFHGTVEFFGCVSRRLADFPHENVDDGVPALLEHHHELLHRSDAVRLRHLGPFSGTSEDESVEKKRIKNQS